MFHVPGFVDARQMSSVSAMSDRTKQRLAVIARSGYRGR